jgi:hypothetical protein
MEATLATQLVLHCHVVATDQRAALHEVWGADQRTDSSVMFFSTATSEGERVDMSYLLLAVMLAMLVGSDVPVTPVPASAHSEIMSLGEIYVLFA